MKNEPMRNGKMTELGGNGMKVKKNYILEKKSLISVFTEIMTEGKCSSANKK